MSDRTQPKNLTALSMGTGEFCFSPGATSLADARSKGYLDFGNVKVTGLKNDRTVVEHKGSYRGELVVDKRRTTEVIRKYTIKCDEIAGEKLKIAIGGDDAADITQSVQTNATGATLGFTAVAAVINRWYDLLISGAHVGEITGLLLKRAAVSCVAANATETFTAVAHGLLDGQGVVFAGSVLPTGLTANTLYYVVNKAADTFQVAATSGGSAVAFSTDGTSVTFARTLLADTDYVLDAKQGRVRFLTAQALDLTPVITASAIVSGDAANLRTVTPTGDLTLAGYGRIAIFDSEDPNVVIYDHYDFSCEVILENGLEFDGAKHAEMDFTVSVTDVVGTASFRKDS